MSPISSPRRHLAAGAIAVTAALVAVTVQTGSATAVPGRDAAIAQAKANVARYAGTFGFGAGQDLQVKDVILDADGTQHVRFDRTYQGLPVVGGDLVVHQDAHGRLKDSSHGKAHDPKVKSTVPAVPAQASASSALRDAEGISSATSTPELIVWAADGTPRLAWRTTVAGLGDHGQPAGKVVVTDASTGEQIEAYDAEHQAVGTGHSEYTGDVAIDTTPQNGGYALIDPTRGHITKDANNVSSSSLNASSGTLFTDADNVWGDGKKFTGVRATAAVDAHANTAWTYDYYKNTFGRSASRTTARAPPSSCTSAPSGTTPSGPTPASA